MSQPPWDMNHPALSDDARVRRALWGELRRRWDAMKRDGDDVRLTKSVFEVDTEPVIDVAVALTGTTRPVEADKPQFWYSSPFRRIEEAAYYFVSVGILRPDSKGNTKFFLTAFGAKCLEGDDDGLAFDSAGFVQAFEKDFGQVPEADVVARYLGQASTALQHHMDLACATLIGCAYELSMLQLADAVVDRWGDDEFQVGNLGSDHKKVLRAHRNVRLAAKTPPPIGDKRPYAPHISDLIDAVEAALKAADKETPNLLPEHSDWVASALASTYFHVRQMRNKAGHPTGKVIARADLYGAVVLFTPTYRHVRGIIEALARAPKG